MARKRQDAEFEIEVGGEPYVWRLQRRPHWSINPDERHGMAVCVRHGEGQREAVLEFPVGQKPRFGAPQLLASQIPEELVATAIGSAIAAGWEPLSRGKAVTFVVDAEGR